MSNSGPNLKNFAAFTQSMQLCLTDDLRVWQAWLLWRKLPVQYVKAGMSTSSAKITDDGPAGKSSKSVADKNQVHICGAQNLFLI